MIIPIIITTPTFFSFADGGLSLGHLNLKIADRRKIYVNLFVQFEENATIFSGNVTKV